MEWRRNTLVVIEESIKGTYGNLGMLLSPQRDLSHTYILYYYYNIYDVRIYK
jgi:hypothetical protein